MPAAQAQIDAMNATLDATTKLVTAIAIKQYTQFEAAKDAIERYEQHHGANAFSSDLKTSLLNDRSPFNCGLVMGQAVSMLAMMSGLFRQQTAAAN